jgi:hypothetical protein
LAAKRPKLATFHIDATGRSTMATTRSRLMAAL